MLNDFIPIRKSVDFNAGPITIVPLSDAHYGAEEFNEVLWHQAIQRIQDDPKCYCVLVGDMINNGIKSSVSNVYRQTAMPAQQKKWLINELSVVSDKILAAVGGNHEKRNIREVDNDPMYDVMLAIGREEVYRPSIAFLSITFDALSKGKPIQRTAFKFAITHGSGGGMYIGSSANRVQTFGAYIEGIDCLITGHTHKPVTFPVSKLVFDGGAKTVLQRQFTVVVASSFLDYGGYPVEKLMTPTAKTITEIQIFPDHDHDRLLRVIQ